MYHDSIVPGNRPTWQGPDIEGDIGLFRSNQMTEPEPFHKDTSFMVRMYGLGIKELEFLTRNPNLREREEQLETLELYHILKFQLGASNVEDMAEQLEFCFYAIRQSRSASPWDQGPGFRHPARLTGTPEHQAKCDRQREFQIAKIMADRLWGEFLATGGRRSPIILRRQTQANGYRRQGDWCKLTPSERRRLLGAEGPCYEQHPMFLQLATKWLLEDPTMPIQPLTPEYRHPVESPAIYGVLGITPRPGSIYAPSESMTFRFRCKMLKEDEQVREYLGYMKQSTR